MAEIIVVDAHLTIEQAKEDAYEVLKNTHPLLPNVELVHTDTIRRRCNCVEKTQFVFEVK